MKQGFSGQDRVRLVGHHVRCEDLLALPSRKIQRRQPANTKTSNTIKQDHQLFELLT